jgi:TRAP-type C4-dicarboxylate transport system substrate-binding protein
MRLAFPVILFGFLFHGLAFFFSAPFCQAEESRYQLKVGTIAPQGSVWANRFDEFCDAVKQKTKGQVKFKVYYGGVMGDDRAMYLKMRIGQLQGAGMTVIGLSEIIPDFRVLSIPFFFENYREVDATWAALLPVFKEKFEDRGLELLSATEVGFVYIMSSQQVSSPHDLKKTKCWIPNGDPLSLAFLQKAGVTPVPLDIADVLTSLQTGLINTVFNGYYGSIVLQWFTKTPFISDVPFGYAYGGLVLDRKAFLRLPPEYQQVVRQEAKLFIGEKLLRDTRTSNEQAFATLKENGITIMRIGENDKKAYFSIRDAVIAKSRGKLFSADILSRAEQALGESRHSPR